jgi:hypothetical protein
MTPNTNADTAVTHSTYASRCPICGRGGEPPVTLAQAAEQLQLPLWKLRRAAKANVFPTYYLHDSKALCFVDDIHSAILRSRKEGGE